MGILEFHFHDSTFEFAPSKTVGADEDDERESTSKPAAPGVDLADSRERASVLDAAKKGVGVLVALGVLVGLGALGKKLVAHRRTETAEEPAEEAEAASAAGESIEITDD